MPSLTRCPWSRVGVALAAAAMAVAIVPVVASLVDAVRAWAWGDGLFWSGAAPFRGPHDTVMWTVAGLVPAAGLAAVIGRWADRRAARFAFGLWGLGQVALAGLAVMQWDNARMWGEAPPFPTIDVVGFAIAALAAIAVASGLVHRTDRRHGAGVVLAVLLTAFGLYPSLARTVVEATPQRLPEFRLEFVAVDGIGSDTELPADVQVLEHNGMRYLVRDDRWTLATADVERIRWDPDDAGDGLTIVLRGAAIDALRLRSRARLERSDAVMLDGRVMTVATYRAVLGGGTLYLSAGDRPAEIRAVYRALTGTAPP